MEKAKKKIVSSAVFVAIVAVVVCFALIFGNAGNTAPFAGDTVAVTGSNADGMINGIYTAISGSEATARYNDLTSAEGGYTGISGQTAFENTFKSGNEADIAGKKYALDPAHSYTVTSSMAYWDQVTLDGCGATVKITSQPDLTELGADQEALNLPYGQYLDGSSGYGAGTLFDRYKRANNDEGIFIKVSGGIAGYALGVKISNCNFEYKLSSSYYYERMGEDWLGQPETEPDDASYLYGGLFGVLSVGDGSNPTTTGSVIDNCRIYCEATIEVKKTVSGAGRDKVSLPYHGLVAFGTIAGYCYDSKLTNSEVEISNNTNITLRSHGTSSGTGGNKGTPRSIIGGAFGILQNDCLVSDIYLTGGGKFTCDVSGKYYMTQGSARLGLGGGLIGCVVDKNSSGVVDYMVNGSGTAVIKNVVSSWTGEVVGYGAAAISNSDGDIYNYDGKDGKTVTGAIVGITGSYYNNGAGASNMSGIYFLYNGTGDAPSYKSNFFADVSGGGYSYSDFNYAYIAISEDGTDWLGNSAGNRKTTIDFDETGSNLTLTFDVSSEASLRKIVWEYSISDIIAGGNPETYSVWEQSGGVDVTSFDTAVKTQTVSVKNSTDGTGSSNKKYAFVSGQAVFYDVSNPGETFSDEKEGEVVVRRYETADYEYNATALTAPQVNFYLRADKEGSPLETSVDNSQWQAFIDGIGDGVDVGSDETKAVNSWHVALVTETKEFNSKYAYYASTSKGNFVAYKADNTVTSDTVEGSPVGITYYIYNVTPKTITPSVTPEADREYDGEAKEYNVNFNGEVFAGDSVKATLSVFSLAGDVESPSALGAINAGNYRVKITALDNANYQLSDSVAACDFAIEKRAITASIDTSQTSFVYNKQAQAPTVTVDRVVGDPSNVYSVSYVKDGVPSTNTDAGNYQMTISLKNEAMGNYELGGTLTGTFEITPAPLTYIGEDSYSMIYDSYSVSVQKLTDKGIMFRNEELDQTLNIKVSFRKKGESEYNLQSIKYVGKYDCQVTSSSDPNYQTTTKEISIEITKAPVSFGIIPNYDGEFDENYSVGYTGGDMSFIASVSNIGVLDNSAFNFHVVAYPAVYDDASGKWVKQEGAEGVSIVHDAGNYLAVLEYNEDIKPLVLDNYDMSNTGSRELAFSITKKELIWHFTGTEGLEYDEASGKYSVVYNGQYHKLAFEDGNVSLNDLLAPGDKNKYSFNVVDGVISIEYFNDTEGGVYSVGTDGVRDAGSYLVVPEIVSGNNPDLFVNYDIKGGTLEVRQKPVTVVVKDVTIPYGTDLDMLSEETYESMWEYGSEEQFLPEDEENLPLLTFIWEGAGLDENPVRGTYPFSFAPSFLNENAKNYDITFSYETGDHAFFTVTGLELEVEVVVTDKDGNKIVNPIADGKYYETSALYNGGDYTVTLRATNYVDGNPAVKWKADSASFVFRNNVDSKKVTFALSDEANKVYYIHEDLSGLGQADGLFTVKFTVEKRTINVTPNDVEVEYGKEFADNGAIFDGEFVEGERDWFTYTVSLESELGSEIGATANVNVSVAAVAEHQDAAGNYDFVCNNGTATRVRREIHITFTDRGKYYGDEVLSVMKDTDYTIVETDVTDELEVKYVLTDAEGAEHYDAVNLAAGEYAIGAEAGNDNYTLVVTEGNKFTVNKKAVNVTFTPVEVEYDAAAHPIGYSIDGLITGDEGVTAVISYTGIDEGDPVNAGEYVATVVGFSSPNYSVGTVTGDNTVKISRISVTITVLDGVSAYGSDDIVPANGTYFTSDSALFDAEDVQPYYSYIGSGSVDSLALGEYANTLTLGFNGAAASNYDYTFAGNAKLTVNAADLADVASLSELSSVYDGTSKTVTVNGVKTAEVSVAITLDGETVTEIRNAGTYTFTVTPAAGNTNYTGSATLTYTVDKADFDGVLTADNSVYDGNAVVLAVDPKYGEVIFTITLNGEVVTEIRNAGTYAVTATAGENSNYVGTVEGMTYVVNKAQIPTPTLQDITVTAVWNGFTVTDKNGKFSVLVTLDDSDWSNATNSVSGLKPETEYTVYVKFEGDANYVESGVLSTGITTGKKLAATLDPSDVTYTVYYNKIVVTVKGEGSFAYSSDGGKKWQDGNTLSGLKAGTEYSVSVKIKESDTQGESNVVTVKLTTGNDPAAFNDAFNALGDTVTAADLDNYDKMMEAYEGLADGDKANVDKTKLDKLTTSYNALIAEVNGDVIAAQNVAKKAAGKGVAAAAASVLAVVIAAIVAKKKFVF